MEPVFVFQEDPSVYHVLNRDSLKKRCTRRLKKDNGGRCRNNTTFIDKHFKPVCGLHLNKYDRMVNVAEFRMKQNHCYEYRVLRETTMRDELKIFSEPHNCSICLNEIRANSSVVTSCGHFFHQDCLSEWLHIAKKHTCPICREVLKSEALEIESEALEIESEAGDDLYSVLDIIESPETRMRIRRANIHFLIDRIHSYDVAVDLAGFFHSVS